jgi:leucyl/phenylalanyl-tRNA--protein transferase
MPPVYWHNPDAIPDPTQADEDGLVAVGGLLEPQVILRAYRAGLFPWSSQPVLTWWSPDPRAVIELQTFRQHRSTRQSVRQRGWRFTVDHAFDQVMRCCAAPAPGRETTWISGDFLSAYGALHRRGYAHSVEVWEGEELVGGLYGVAIGAYFGGESMFHRREDASKAAVGHLVEVLRRGGFTLLDAQAPTPHLSRLGASALPRPAYLRRLAEAVSVPQRPFA